MIYDFFCCFNLDWVDWVERLHSQEDSSEFVTVFLTKFLLKTRFSWLSDIVLDVVCSISGCTNHWGDWIMLINTSTNIHVFRHKNQISWNNWGLRELVTARSRLNNDIFRRKTEITSFSHPFFDNLMNDSMNLFIWAHRMKRCEEKRKYLALTGKYLCVR